MIQTELLDLINSGTSWLFVGSGVSKDAGMPDWENLLSLVEASLQPDQLSEVETQRRYKALRNERDFPACLDLLSRVAGRSLLESTIRKALRRSAGKSGTLLRQITDFPFAGYVTTNYDTLIEESLQGQRQPWIPVGNTPSEVRQVSGGAKGLIWHVHGSLDMPADRSHMLITAQDYETYYLESSPLVRQLQSFLSQNRFVFIGFGFQDREFNRLLKLVKRYTIPERPLWGYPLNRSGPG